MAPVESLPHDSTPDAAAPLAQPPVRIGDLLGFVAYVVAAGGGLPDLDILSATLGQALSPRAPEDAAQRLPARRQVEPDALPAALECDPHVSFAGRWPEVAPPAVSAAARAAASSF